MQYLSFVWEKRIGNNTSVLLVRRSDDTYVYICSFFRFLHWISSKHFEVTIFIWKHTKKPHFISISNTVQQINRFKNRRSKHWYFLYCYPYVFAYVNNTCRLGSRVGTVFISYINMVPSYYIFSASTYRGTIRRATAQRIVEIGWKPVYRRQGAAANDTRTGWNAEWLGCTGCDEGVRLGWEWLVQLWRI